MALRYEGHVTGFTTVLITKQLVGHAQLYTALLEPADCSGTRNPGGQDMVRENAHAEVIHSIGYKNSNDRNDLSHATTGIPTLSTWWNRAILLVP